MTELYDRISVPDERLPTGKKPAQPARPQLKASRFLDSAQLPDPPAALDNLTRVVSWPPYGNFDWGDCVPAGIAHQEQQISLFGQGVEVRVTDPDVIGFYSAVTGFNPNAGPPGNNPTDQGTWVQDAMAWWRKTGISGHQIVAYASIDPTDTRLIKQCIHLFGAVGIGFNFPASAWEQFDDGIPWDVVAGAPLEGGHYVIVGAYDSDLWTTVTWGTTQKMTQRFWQRYTDEVWLVIDDEMADTLTGKTGFAGIDLYQLGQDFTALTGEPNPIPAPGPAPTPAHSPAAQRLYDEQAGWAYRPAVCGKSARRSLRTFFEAEGFPRP